MLSVEADITIVDFKVLEQEIEHVLRRPDKEQFSGRYIQILDDDNKDAFMMLRQRMLDNEATMKVLYDECPTQFQFGIK